MKRSDRTGFTLIELLMVVAIITILAAILFPVFAQARDKARQTTCLSNTRQLAMGVMMYTQDYDEIIPAARNEWTMPIFHSAVGDLKDYPAFWFVVIQPYLKSTTVTKCPSDGDARVPTSYAYNYPHMSYRLAYPETLFRLSQYPAPANTLIFGESQAGLDQDAWTLKYLYCPVDWPPGTLGGRGDANGMAFRHQGGAILAFLDGHARWVRREKVVFSDNDPNSSSAAANDVRRLWGHPPFGPDRR